MATARVAVGERGCEHTAATMESAHDGAEGNAEGVGGIAVGEFFDVDEADDVAEGGGEVVEGAGYGLSHAPHGGLGLVLGPGARVEVEGVEGAAFAGAFAALGQKDAVLHLVEPGTEVGASFEAPGKGERAQRSFLDEVECFVA